MSKKWFDLIATIGFACYFALSCLDPYYIWTNKMFVTNGFLLVLISWKRFSRRQAVPTLLISRHCHCIRCRGLCLWMVFTMICAIPGVTYAGLKSLPIPLSGWLLLLYRLLPGFAAVSTSIVQPAAARKQLMQAAEKQVLDQNHDTFFGNHCATSKLYQQPPCEPC